MDNKPNKKCPVCSKKLMLTSISCRCGKRYCPSHRLAEAHSCSFDYKQHAREELTKSVVKCIPIKVDKI